MEHIHGAHTRVTPQVLMASSDGISGKRLEVRLAVFSVRLWLFLLPSAVVAVLIGFSDQDAFGYGLAISLLVFLVGTLVVQTVMNVSKNRAGPVMVLDRNGVTVGSYPSVRWDHVDRIVVGPVARGLFPAAMWGDVVAFIPKAGVVMPPPPGGRNVGAEKQEAWRQARLQRYGTNLTVVTAVVNVTTRELTDAADRWGHVPIRRLRRARKGEVDQPAPSEG